MRSFVIDLLKERIPSCYYYHTYEHTLYVTDKAAEIGRKERCKEPEMKLVNIAALWHDTGYINTYVHHEEESCSLARYYLPGYGLSKPDIDKVCGMIMATKIPQTPHNKLEKIIADADLEYLGTPDAGIYADKLFREHTHVKPGLTKEQWNRVQVVFLQKHHYFTRFCKEIKEPLKSAYLNTLLKELNS